MKNAFRFLLVAACFIIVINLLMKDNNRYRGSGSTSASSSDFMNSQTQENLQDIKDQVAKDAEEQYYIVQREGDRVQIAVQAGIVAAAYLQAKDEENYRKWKAIEKEAKRHGRLLQ